MKIIGIIALLVGFGVVAWVVYVVGKFILSALWDDFGPFIKIVAAIAYFAVIVTLLILFGFWAIDQS